MCPVLTPGSNQVGVEERDPRTRRVHNGSTNVNLQLALNLTDVRRIFLC